MMRAIRFVPDAWDAYLYWQQQDKKTLKRINALINEATRDPFRGIGKPEPLRGHLNCGRPLSGPKPMIESFRQTLLNTHNLAPPKSKSTPGNNPNPGLKT